MQIKLSVSRAEFYECLAGYSPKFKAALDKALNEAKDAAAKVRDVRSTKSTNTHTHTHLQLVYLSMHGWPLRMDGWITPTDRPTDRSID